MSFDCKEWIYSAISNETIISAQTVFAHILTMSNQIYIFRKLAGVCKPILFVTSPGLGCTFPDNNNISVMIPFSMCV